MRSKNSFINIAVSIGGQALSFALAIVGRAIMARLLPPQYLGVNSLFSNILSILSMAELGIGSAMIYALYQPVASEDKDSICRLINLYGKLYRMVALIVAVLGLLLIPFLNVLIKDGSSIDNLVLIYILYLIQSVSSYLFVYKASLIEAYQKRYIIDIYMYGFNVLMRVLQIVALLLTKDFMVYLLIYIVCTILPNIFVSIKAEKMYPYITVDKKVLPSKEERKVIFTNMRALFLQNVGDAAVYNTDNLIMSSFLGLVSVGIYTNYSLIVTTLKSILNRIFSACSASVGNLVATESNDHIKEVFDAFYLLDYIAFGYCTVAMAVVFRPFILFVYGKDFLLTDVTVYLLLISFYIDGMRKTPLHFRNAYGIFRQDKWRIIPEAVMNLIVSIILVKQIGIAGIVAGTVISQLAFPFWIEPLYLFKCGFKNTKYFGPYLGKYAFRTGLMVLVIIVTRLITDNLSDGSFTIIIVKGLIATAIYAVVILIVYGRRKEFKRLIEYLTNSVSSIKNKED